MLHAGPFGRWHPHLKGKKRGFKVSGWVSIPKVPTALHKKGLRCMLTTCVCWLHQPSKKSLQDLRLQSSCPPAAITHLVLLWTDTASSKSNPAHLERTSADAQIIHLSFYTSRPTTFIWNLFLLRNMEHILHQAMADFVPISARFNVQKILVRMMRLGCIYDAG